jgi:hypothetical protein
LRLCRAAEPALNPEPLLARALAAAIFANTGAQTLTIVRIKWFQPLQSNQLASMALNTQVTHAKR